MARTEGCDRQQPGDIILGGTASVSEYSQVEIASRDRKVTLNGRIFEPVMRFQVLSDPACPMGADVYWHLLSRRSLP